MPEDNQHQESQDQSKLRQQWLREDLWSLYEFSYLCCGYLDERGVDPYSYVYWQQAAGVRPKSYEDQKLVRDIKDIKTVDKKEFDFAYKAIQRGIQEKELSPVFPPNDLINDEWDGVAYYREAYFRPTEAIRWVESRLAWFPQFPFRRHNLEEALNHHLSLIELSLNATNPNQTLSMKRHWLEERSLWNWLELRNLCCGLSGDQSIKEIHPLFHASLYHADEAIRRAVFIGQLRPFEGKLQSLEEVSPLSHTKYYDSDDTNQSFREFVGMPSTPEVEIHRSDFRAIWALNLAFKLEAAIDWASARFIEFPFNKRDYFILSLNEEEKKVIGYSSPMLYLCEEITNHPVRAITLKDLEPDWSKYEQYQHLPLQVAILLSVGVCPDWEDRLKFLLSTKEAPRLRDIPVCFDATNQVVIEENRPKIYSLYWPRLKVALTYADIADWKYDNVSDGSFTESSAVWLNKFCNWLLEQNFEIHERFRSIGYNKNIVIDENRNEPKKQVNQKSKKGRPYALAPDKEQLLVKMKQETPSLKDDFLAKEFGIAKTSVRNILKRNVRN